MIYLYVKTHNKTGLKYLGKTVYDDVDSYQGSGKIWKRHIKKHGYDVTTEIIFVTANKDEIKEKGIYYSNLWNIVESDDWANLKPEEGDGGKIVLTDEIIAKRKQFMLTNNPFKGKKHSEETKQKIKDKRKLQVMPIKTEEQRKQISESLMGHTVSEETKKKISVQTKGKSKSNKGQPKRKIDCPHCGKIGAIAMMIRWHFNNCKRKI
jgi:hypothetical protein